MPTAPKQHGQTLRKGISQHKPKRDDQFYNLARWGRLRRMVLNRQPICPDPYGAHRGRTVPATDVDHIKPRRAYPELAWDMDNLRALCKACHTRKTNDERLERG